MGRPRQPINHGTIGGHRAHYRHGVPMCEPCRDAVRRREGHQPFRPAVCGTVSAYNRHLHHGETPCDACREANRLRGRAWRQAHARKPKVITPMDPWDARHGTVNGYTNLACRCRRCTAAGARDSADRRARYKKEAS